MADGLKAALQSKLATYESAGMTDHADRVKARIVQLDKAAKKEAAPAAAPATLSTTVKKSAAKKTAAKKRK